VLKQAALGILGRCAVAQAESLRGAYLRWHLLSTTSGPLIFSCNLCPPSVTVPDAVSVPVRYALRLNPRWSERRLVPVAFNFTCQLHQPRVCHLRP
jgi:hypothetical protein